MAALAIRVVGDRRGGAAVLVALCLSALGAVVCCAVDLGHIYMRSRQLQGAADLAAMAAASAMASASGSPADAAQASAQSTAALNLWPGADTTAHATVGAYTPDPALSPAARFTPGPAGSPGAGSNAVRVTLDAQVPLFFAGLITGRQSLTVSRTATAAETQLAAFSIGSGLAGVNGGVLNAVLSAMTGSQVSLSAMDSQALAGAQVSLFDYLPALRTRAGLGAASFDQTLAAKISPSTQLAALADALAAEGQAAAAGPARALAAAAANLTRDSLAPLIALGPYGGQDHASGGSGATIDVNALSLVDALLSMANGSRQLSFSLDGAVPGLAGLKVWLAIGQRPSDSPWLAVGQAGQVTVRTAQTRLYLQASVAPGTLGALAGGSNLNFPAYVEAASAQAVLTAVQCPSDASARGFDLTVTPSLGTLAIAAADPSALNSFGRTVSLTPAVVIDAPLLKATAFGQATLGGGSSGGQAAHFSAADVAGHTMKTVSVANLAAETTTSLLGSTTFQVQAGGSGIGLGSGGSTGAALSAALAPAATALDTVIGQIEALSGARVGVANVWPDGLRCNGAALVA